MSSHKTGTYRGKSENLPIIQEYSIAKFGKGWNDLDDRQKQSVRRSAAKDVRYVKKQRKTIKKNNLEGEHIDEAKLSQGAESRTNDEAGNQ